MRGALPVIDLAIPGRRAVWFRDLMFAAVARAEMFRATDKCLRPPPASSPTT